MITIGNHGYEELNGRMGRFAWYGNAWTFIDVVSDRELALVKEIERLRNAAEIIEHLSAGSFGTARDNGIGLMIENETIADEFKHLASNFQRIEELAKAAR